MREGAFDRLNSMRRLVVQAVVMAFILPVLIGLLPQPGLSAAAALDHDLLTAVCGPDSPPQPDGGTPHQGHDHCVLCASHGLAGSPGLAGSAPAFAAAPPRLGAPAMAAAGLLAPPLQALLDASPPRGPPAIG